ncbi:tripartite tricarboxylate transporter substrate binding protein [Hydrogenophaga sp.]|uniref:Bug family tripartite tricarboxylate transporter substrate binding protein n=1 Tax=Hydrogenophaga sp. TaxID=1904254 RepID=UPI0027291F64|nr:tripartite tricarboxylate transporter substrate binding protein [Hydrogenophaga sp.]MDO9438599.1 tripartite tricarboxylate transporter substrate binding protein [Hydrogenophaga sp.]
MRNNNIHRLQRRVVNALLACAAVAGLGVSAPALAQPYPSKPVTIVVPYPPGGASDALARLLGDQLKDALGQPVLVVNRPGAGSLIGTQSVIRAPKDGYTLLFTGSALTIQAAVNKKFDVNLERDLAPISEMVRSTFLIATQTARPFKTVPELVKFAREHPKDLSFGTNGAGTTSFMIFEYLKSLTQVELLHVPYKGSAEAVAAVMAGDIQLVADPVYTLHKQVEAGNLRGLAVTGNKRSALLPNVPTVEEAGYPDFNITAWIGLLAPAGTPKPIVDRLGEAVMTIMKDPEVAKRSSALGFDPSGTTPDEFNRKLRTEQAMWTKLARDRNLQID